MQETSPKARRATPLFITRIFAPPFIWAVLFFILWRILNTQLAHLYGYCLPEAWWDPLDRWALQPFMLLSCITAAISFLILPRIFKNRVLQGIWGSNVEFGEGDGPRHRWLAIAACFLIGCTIRGIALWADWITNLSPQHTTSVATNYEWLPGLFVTHALVSLAEEFVWRGVLLNLLLTCFRPLLTLILTGLAFGFWHLLDGQHNFWSVLEIGCSYGLLCGVVFYRTGSLWPSVALHLSMNFVLYSYDHLMGRVNNAYSVSLYTYFGKLAFYCLLFVVLYCVGRKQLWKTWQHMK